MSEAGSDTLEFSGIAHVGKRGTGTFKATEKQFGWMCTEPGMPKTYVAFPGEHIESAAWQRACGKGKCLLKIRVKGDPNVRRFAGFRKEAIRSLRSHMQKNFGIKAEEEDLATEGLSFGDWSLDGNHELQLLLNGKRGMELPIPELNQVATLGKGELNLLLQEAPPAAPDDEVLHEVRLVVPGNAANSETPEAEKLRDELQRRAGISATTGEAIARVGDVNVVAPRGKHDFEFFPQAVQIHGKTQNYTLKYRNIARLFLLEMPQDGSVNIVLGLDQPLRQGQQLHTFLVLNFDKAKEIKLDLPDKTLLSLKMKRGEYHPVFSLVGKLLKDLSGKTVVASSTEFKELHPQNEPCVRCTHKTHPGFLFPLKKSVVFVTKPVIWLTYDDIAGIEFMQGALRRNTFDLVVHQRSGQPLEFSQLEKTTYKAVFDFLRKVGVKIKNEEEALSQITLASTSARRGGGDRAQRSSAAAAGGKAPGRKPGQQPAEDYDEEEDEDFDEDDDDGSGSSADDDDDDDDEEEEAPKKKRAKK